MPHARQHVYQRLQLDVKSQSDKIKDRSKAPSWSGKYLRFGQMCRSDRHLAPIEGAKSQDPI
jgi:hypothetical protein